MSENTDIIRNTRATLETLYHISRELAAALDLQTVLRRVLYLAVEHVEAASGSIIILDDKGQPVESAIIHDAQLYDETTDQLRITLEQGLAGWVIKNRQAVLIQDTTQDDRWYQRSEETVDQLIPKSAVSAPLLAREEVVGVITLVHPETGFFNLDHLDLVQAIADQAGIAVLNARLYVDSRRQARVMTALAETAAVINATLNLEDVFRRLMEQIEQALQVQAASLALVDPFTGEIEFKAATGWVGEQVVGTILQPGQGIAGWVAKNNQEIIVSDVQYDDRFDPETDRRTGYTTEAIACAPIRLQGEVIGVLEAINPIAGQFDSDALLVLSGIGNLAGTAIRHAQLFESLEAAHQRYRELFEDSIDPILITNRGGKIIEANRRAEQATGYAAEELRDLYMSDFHLLDRASLGEDFQKVLNSKETVIYESSLMTRSGEQIPINVYIRPVEIDGQENLQWILRNIKERKNLENMRENLIAMIYHDLRSPLANVLSSLDVLKSMLPQEENDAVQSVLKIAQRSTERIQRLTNSLLDVNRLSNRKQVLSPGPTSLRELVNDVVEALDLMLVSKKQTLEINLPEDLRPVYVDSDMVRRVLINLLENAIKYTKSNGHIMIGAAQEGSWMQVWVEDNGQGIPDEEKQMIFEKFNRLRMPEDENKGLGLGLTFCRLVVEAHGGDIWVESRVGEGSRFTFTIPTELVVEPDQKFTDTM